MFAFRVSKLKLSAVQLLHAILCELLPHKELGWGDEIFTRFYLFRSRWMNIYLHFLECPERIAVYHDHPFNFAGTVLSGGYLEETPDGRVRRRRPSELFYHRAEFAHTVWAPGGPSWSIVVTQRHRRIWNQFGPDELLPEVEFIRADGRCLCKSCGLTYYRHPMAGPKAYDGSQILHRLCDGTLVKT